MTELILKDEVFSVIGAAMEVHNEFGRGFLEAVYQEVMEIELASQGIPFESLKLLVIHYQGRPLKKEYIADFECFGQVIVEIKALDHLTTKEEAQILNYLKATRRHVGLLINFGCSGKPEWKRFVH